MGFAFAVRAIGLLTNSTSLLINTLSCRALAAPLERRIDCHGHGADENKRERQPKSQKDAPEKRVHEGSDFRAGRGARRRQRERVAGAAHTLQRDPVGILRKLAPQIADVRVKTAIRR